MSSGLKGALVGLIRGIIRLFVKNKNKNNKTLKIKRNVS